MRNPRIKLILLAIGLLLMFPQFSFAVPPSYTFSVNLDSIALDASRSASNTLGFNNWFVWKYKIDVISSGTRGHALSHWVLELPNCYLTDSELFEEIEASAGWGGGDQIRVYDPEAVNPDPTTGLKGLKWDHVSGDELDAVGEYDYFWFSAPTNLSIEDDWAVKAGQDIITGTTDVPACPGGNCDPGIPEPLTLLMFASGLAGFGILKRGKR